MIYCPICKKHLGQEHFLAAIWNRKNVKKNVCRSCRNLQCKAYRQTPEAKAKRKAKDLENKERINRGQRRRKYGLTPAEYDELMQIQECQNPGCTNKATCIDHCHSSSKVRGVLCRECNLSLGHLCDNPTRISGLLEYISKH